MTSSCEAAPNAFNMTVSADSTNWERRCCTVTVAVCVTDPLATVTVVMPLPRAVTRPEELTVATAVSAEASRRRVEGVAVVVPCARLQLGRLASNAHSKW